MCLNLALSRSLAQNRRLMNAGPFFFFLNRIFFFYIAPVNSRSPFLHVCSVGKEITLNIRTLTHIKHLRFLFIFLSKSGPSGDLLID